MFMVASSVVTTIMILNYHHRQSDMHQMPAWVGFYLYSVHFITERRERERERSREKYCNNLDKMLLSTGLLSVLSLRCFNQRKRKFTLQVKLLFLQWIPWLLRMSRPGQTLTRKTIMMQTKMKKLDLKENHSKSLLANVLEMEDDYQPITQFLRFAKIKDSASFFRLVFRAQIHIR